MTITEAEELQIAKYLDKTYSEVHEKLTYLNTLNGVTAALETKIRAELTRWTDNNLDTDFTRVEGNLKNFGANINPDDLRASIRKALANYLYFQVTTGGSGWGYSTRS